MRSSMPGRILAAALQLGHVARAARPGCASWRQSARTLQFWLFRSSRLRLSCCESWSAICMVQLGLLGAAFRCWPRAGAGRGWRGAPSSSNSGLRRQHEQTGEVSAVKAAERAGTASPRSAGPARRGGSWPRPLRRCQAPPGALPKLTASIWSCRRPAARATSAPPRRASGPAPGCTSRPPRSSVWPSMVTFFLRSAESSLALPSMVERNSSLTT